MFHFVVINVLQQYSLHYYVAKDVIMLMALPFLSYLF